MTFPWPAVETFDAETTGSSPNAAVFGCDSIAGVGTWTVVAPGLNGSAKALEITCADNQRRTVTAVPGDVVWVAGKFQADAPPTNATTDIVKCLNASAVTQARLFFDADGVLKIGSTGSIVEATTGFEYLGNPDAEGGPVPGATYDFLYRFDAGLFGGSQTLWVTGPGHSKKLGPKNVDVGPDPVTTVEVGICSNATVTITFDDLFVTDTQPPVPELVELSSVIPGNVGPDSVDLVANVYGYTSIQARVYESGGIDPVYTTGAVPILSTDRAKITVTGLAPFTWYDYEIDAFLDEVRTSVGERGSFRTAPPLREPVESVRVFVTGCELNNNSTPVHHYTWDYAKTAGFDYAWHGGDLHYANSKSMTVGPHRDAIAAQLRTKTTMREFISQVGWLGYNPSDHDGGGGNAAAVQDPSTVYSIQAWDECWPHAPAADLGGEKTRATVAWVGRTKFVMPDFRTTSRSNALDPDTDAKVAYSVAQEAWLIQHIADPSAALVVLCFDQPWPGDAADQGGVKEDHMALYPNQRGRINTAIASRLASGLGCFIVQADYHGLVARDPGTGIDDTCGGAGLIGPAGARNNTGNIRELDWPNYDQTWGEDNPGDQSDIWVSGELTITDDGLTISVLGQGRDNEAGVYRVESSDTWDVPFTVPRLAEPSYDLGPLALTDLAGRFKLLVGTELPPVPPKSAAVTSLPYTHGVTIDSVFTEGGRLVLQVLVTDHDTNGDPGGRLQRDVNIDTLKGICGDSHRLTVGYRPQWTEGVTRAATGYVLASMPVRDLGTSHATAVVTVDLEHAFTSTLVKTWSLDLTDGGVDGEPVDIFTSSTAPITTALFRCSGGVFSFQVSDETNTVALEREWLRVAVPDGYFTGEANPDMLPLDKAVVVDGWSVWLIDDADGFDTTDGVDVSGWLVSTSNGEVPLVLYPRPVSGDPHQREVLVRVKRGYVEGSPLLQIRGTEAFY